MDTAVNWDSKAADYQEVFKRCGSNEYNKKLMSFFIEDLALKPGDSVIDIGCGVGKYGTMLAALGFDVALSDISPEMLRLAKENMAPLPGKHSFLCCDFNFVSLSEPVLSAGYKLAMSTMSPAIHDENTLKKFSALSRDWCFLSNFCDWQQPMRDEFYKLSGLQEKHRMNVELMNERLALCHDTIRKLGYEPFTKLVDYSWTDLRSPEEAAKRFAPEDCSEDEFSRILEIVKSLCGEKGDFADTVNTRVTWTYWRV